MSVGRFQLVVPVVQRKPWSFSVRCSGRGPPDPDDHRRLARVVDRRRRLRGDFPSAADRGRLVGVGEGDGAGVDLDDGSGGAVATVEQFEFGSSFDGDPIALVQGVAGVLGGPTEHRDVEELRVGGGPFAVALDPVVAGDPQAGPAGAGVADPEIGIGGEVAVDGDPCGHDILPTLRGRGGAGAVGHSASRPAGVH